MTIATRGPAQVGLSEPSIQKLLDVRELEGLRRFQTQVTVHPVHQYAIPKWVKPEGGGRSVKTNTVMLTSDGYDYLNRVMGVQIVQPAFVVDENGLEVPNPIHRKDYIYLRVMGIWRNDVGQLVSYREDIEVDFQKSYEDARLNAVWYTGSGDNRIKHEPEVEMRIEGDPPEQIYDEHGIPEFRVKLPPDQELAAKKKLSQLRTFGLRYIQTVGKTRILKTASGIRSLPLDKPQAVSVAVVGWRDLLTPEQREEEARTTAKAVWGAALSSGSGMSDVELETSQLDVEDPASEATIDAPPEQQELLPDGTPKDDESDLPDIPEWAGAARSADES